MEGLMVDSRTMRIPWHQSSPTCLGTKPLCMAGQSLTFLRHCSGDRRQRERSHQAPPPNSGTHCRGHRVGCTQFSLLALAHFPKLPQGWVCYRIREMGQQLDLGKHPEHHFKNLALTLTCHGSDYPGPSLASLYSCYSESRMDLKR